MFTGAWDVVSRENLARILARSLARSPRILARSPRILARLPRILARGFKSGEVTKGGGEVRLVSSVVYRTVQYGQQESTNNKIEKLLVDVAASGHHNF